MNISQMLEEIKTDKEWNGQIDEDLLIILLEEIVDALAERGIE